MLAFAGALALRALLNVPLGFAFLVFFVGWPLVGTLITIDDDLKGRWSNPDGSVRPPWLQAPFWGQIIAGLVLSSAGGAIDTGWNTHNGAWFWVFAVIGGVVALPMLRKGLKANEG